jgi:hypothetical protein
MFREHGSEASTWVFGIDQELPGVPPPVLIERPDAGLVPYFNEAEHDYYLSSADAGCLTAFNETTNCGSLPADGGAPSPSAVETKTAAISDDPAAAQAGGCSVIGGRLSVGLVLMIAALLGARSRRRRQV